MRKPSKEDQIRSFYQSLSTDDLAERINSEEVTDEAKAIGKLEMNRRAQEGDLEAIGLENQKPLLNAKASNVKRGGIGFVVFLVVLMVAKTGVFQKMFSSNSSKSLPTATKSYASPQSELLPSISSFPRPNVDPQRIFTEGQGQRVELESTKLQGKRLEEASDKREKLTKTLEPKQALRSDGSLIEK